MLKMMGNKIFTSLAQNFYLSKPEGPKKTASLSGNESLFFHCLYILVECSCIIEFIIKLRKRDKMPGYAKHFMATPNKNKFNTGARMIDPAYHMTQKLLLNHILAKIVKILPSIPMLLWPILHNITKFVNH